MLLPLYTLVGLVISGNFGYVPHNAFYGPHYVDVSLYKIFSERKHRLPGRNAGLQRTEPYQFRSATVTMLQFCKTWMLSTVTSFRRPARTGPLAPYLGPRHGRHRQVNFLIYRPK